jgi:hypothetical protein
MRPNTNLVVKFDIKIETGRGCVFAACFRRSSAQQEEMAMTNIRMDILQAHRRLGHMNEDTTRKTAKELGWEIDPGSLQPCEACAVAKAQQKNVIKSSTRIKAEKPNERVFIDLASIKQNMPRPTMPYWLIAVDDFTQLKRVDFLKSKSDLAETLCEKFSKDRGNGMPVKYVRCDNAGENTKFKERANSVEWQLNIDFAPRATPQHNSLAETGFATLLKKARALMADANVPLELRYRLYTKVIRTAAKLDSLVVINRQGMETTRYEIFYQGIKPKWAAHLRTWGEAGVVKLKTLSTAKLEDRGLTCIRQRVV